ncbi:MAG: hypothetical protein OK454_09405 [Thaumarchaeota archaeon]|nr:hypothetical protein [Nitrososphaerota archaeon]
MKTAPSHHTKFTTKETLREAPYRPKLRVSVMASPSRKRKLPDFGLQRRVRARADPEPEIEDFTDDSDEGSEMPNNAEEASGTEDSEEEEDDDVSTQLTGSNFRY